MNPQILIVDDDQVLLDWYVESLSDVYRIVTAQNGQEAVERVTRDSDIDLAVIDYKLPDMTGVDAMKKIKETAPSVPVIIVTAYGDEEVAVESFRSGARDYLKKPFSISELAAKIDFYLSLKNSDKEHRKYAIFENGSTQKPVSASPPVTVSQFHKIQQAVRFINDNYRANIRLEDAAREADMSREHFSRTFKKVMGFSYQGYLNSRRITKAQNLLRTSTMSAVEIALSVGFADATGFGRIFKKMTGYTPTDYRNLPKK